MWPLFSSILRWGVFFILLGASVDLMNQPSHLKYQNDNWPLCLFRDTGSLAWYSLQWWSDLEAFKKCSKKFLYLLRDFFLYSKKKVLEHCLAALQAYQCSLVHRMHISWIHTTLCGGHSQADKQERAVRLWLISFHEHTHMPMIKSEFFTTFMNPGSGLFYQGFLCVHRF